MIERDTTAGTQVRVSDSKLWDVGTVVTVRRNEVEGSRYIKVELPEPSTKIVTLGGRFLLALPKELAPLDEPEKPNV